MSRAFVRGAAEPAVGAFSALLPNIELGEHVSLKRARLGKTAEGLLRLKEEARKEGLAEGRQEGLSIGREEGLDAVREEMAAAVASFREALDQAAARVEGAMGAWYAASEQSLSELAVAVAARILSRELELSRDSITALVKEAIHETVAADKVRIRVNPFDSPVLSREKSLILSANTTVRGVEIVDDPTITGGAIIESESGAIDATIQTQLELALQSIRLKEAA